MGPATRRSTATTRARTMAARPGPDRPRSRACRAIQRPPHRTISRGSSGVTTTRSCRRTPPRISSTPTPAPEWAAPRSTRTSTEWTVVEASGRRHVVGVGRNVFGGLSVSFDRKSLARFDQTPEADRYVTSVTGHVLTVSAPRASTDQPTLNVDGRPVLGSETTLSAPLTIDAAGAAITGQDLARYQLLQRRNGGGAWFYWIGGGSILNSVLFSARGPRGVVGWLAVTHLIAGGSRELTGTVRTPIYAFV